MILKMYNSFYPHIKITLADGKVFDPSNIIINNPRIAEKAFVLEEEVFLKYQQKEFIATVKGVSSSYKELAKFDSLLVAGSYIDSYENNDPTKTIISKIGCWIIESTGGGSGNSTNGVLKDPASRKTAESNIVSLNPFPSSPTTSLIV